MQHPATLFCGSMGGSDFRVNLVKTGNPGIVHHLMNGMDASQIRCLRTSGSDDPVRAATQGSASSPCRCRPISKWGMPSMCRSGRSVIASSWAARWTSTQKLTAGFILIGSARVTRKRNQLRTIGTQLERRPRGPQGDPLTANGASRTATWSEQLAQPRSGYRPAAGGRGHVVPGRADECSCLQ